MTSFLSRDICYRLLIKQFKAMKIIQGTTQEEFESYEENEDGSSDDFSQVSRQTGGPSSKGKENTKE
jgi:hypothetical protein